jgi:predicted transcriptional regulator
LYSRKRRLSSEFTILSILEYLYNNSQNTPVSKFNIVSRTPGIKRQRPDRVNLMIESLLRNGYIVAIKTSKTTAYQITEGGKMAYEKWVKNFLEFARSATENKY